MALQRDVSSQALEGAARSAYDACHPDDSFDDMKRRAAFSKEDRCLLRDWLAATGRKPNRQQVLTESISGTRGRGQ